MIHKLLNRVYDLKIKENNYLEFNLIKKAQKENIKCLEDFINLTRTSYVNIKSVRNEIAHGSYYSDTDLVIIEGNDIMKLGGSMSIDDVTYIEILDSLVFRHLGYMQLNERFINKLLCFLFKKLYRVRIQKGRELGKK